MSKKQEVKVNITVTMKCECTWGDDCTIAQVKRQAREEALRSLTKTLENNHRVERINYGEVLLNTEI